jgi:hypothetical protein
MKKIFLVVFSFCAAVSINHAQSSKKQEIPLVRVYFHEKIDSTQTLIGRYDGIPDAFFKPSDNEELNERINTALTEKVDALQNEIEASKVTENNDKIRYLRGLNECPSKILIRVQIANDQITLSY